MATGDINNKSAKKHIRFPHELIEEINANIESEKSAQVNSNFSSWVIDACERKLSKQKSQKKK
ncbi:YlcI/YnfO family protein [Xenorhabdus vietnamensis]|uniref:YlcI/YnfO family protein n=1 Tax=Xenorhabdus vietnamensis TaxID=351656 RepID=UPI000A3224BE|nr:YlcI/YnfO family protein [Xenorhabdus vietnamensis]